MKLFTATTRTQGERPGDFFWCNPGELVHVGFQCCNTETCGCNRSLCGLVSHSATTTFEVQEMRIGITPLAKQVFDSWQDAGWKTLTMADARRDAKQMQFWASHFEVGDVCDWDGTRFRRRAGAKRTAPRYFPELDSEHWVEIYNALDGSKGLALKLPPDGEGMAGNEKLQAELGQDDWVEIRISVAAKYDRLKEDGDTGDGFISRDNMRDWKRQMRHIIDTLEVLEGAKA